MQKGGYEVATSNPLESERCELSERGKYKYLSAIVLSLWVTLPALLHTFLPFRVPLSRVPYYVFRCLLLCAKVRRGPVPHFPAISSSR